MSWLDNVIGFFSPRTAFERQRWRQARELERSYDAGGHDRINSRWRAENQSGELTDRGQRDTVRARGRDLERNSDMAKAVIHSFRRNVVGRGCTLKARTENGELNDRLEELWKQWTRKRSCDVSGTQSFNQMMRMAVARKKVDGGLIFLRRYTRSGLVPFKLQVLEVDELATDRTEPRRKSNRVAGGIEFDRFNRPVGYYFRQYTLDGFTVMEPVYVPARDVIFYYSRNRPSQVREMSDLSAAIPRIRDANEFINAVSVKERVAACLGLVIKRILPTGGLGRDSSATDGSGRFSYKDKTLSPGMIMEMNAGDEAQVVDPKGTGGDAAEFLRLQQGLIGAGQGLSYETTTRDMSRTNYSSARQGLIEDELTFFEEKELLQEVMTEIYETFVISVYLAGLVDMPGFWEQRAYYMAHDWVDAPRRWIDPLKEAKANQVALQTGQKSFQQIVAESGKDWKEYLRETAEVLDYAKELGIDIEIGGVIFGERKPFDPKPNQGSE
ncbi:MAG: phage portal protein [Oscillospiraceae bacterium]|nr:phage portal protein [Oscillospiraceae bacterium]